MRNDIKDQYGKTIGYSKDVGNRIEYYLLTRGMIGFWDKRTKYYIAVGLGGSGIRAMSDIGTGQVFQLAANASKTINASNAVNIFKGKAESRAFATISASVPSDFFDGDEKATRRYNARATTQMENDLRSIGVEYQRTTGVWDSAYEKSFVVWNTHYSWEAFRRVMLKLNGDYKQSDLLVGIYIDKDDIATEKNGVTAAGYNVEWYTADDRMASQPKYRLVKTYKNISPQEALEEMGTILSRHIYKKGYDGKDVSESIDSDKVKNKIVKFGGYDRAKSEIKLEEKQGHKGSGSNYGMACGASYEQIMKRENEKLTIK
jgi:hypothetical protein